jgi:hypothetical protein
VAASAAAGAHRPACARARPAVSRLRCRTFTATACSLTRARIRSLLVPVFILVAGVAPSDAVPLSICAIAGGAVANFIAYSQRRRSDGAPLIDYGRVAAAARFWPLCVR